MYFHSQYKTLLSHFQELWCGLGKFLNKNPVSKSVGHTEIQTNITTVLNMKR